MKQRWRLVALVVLAVVASALVGCASTLDAFNQAIGELDVAISDSGGAKQTTTDTQRSTTSPMLSGMADFQNTLMFNVAYFQVFFVGGYDPAYDDFKEGEGVTWDITAADDEGQPSYRSERALLRRNADGSSWWYLSYSAEDETLEYEVLLSADYSPVEIAWRDADSGEVRHHEFDVEDEQAMEDQTSDGDPEIYADDMQSQYRKSTDRVTVGAGTFTAELLQFDATDDESGDDLAYSWWVVSSVPGDLVKFEYKRSGADGGVITGELVAIDRNYRTKLGSY